MSWVVDGLSHSRTRPDDSEKHEAGGKASREREHRPCQGASNCDADTGMAVSHAGDDDLQGQSHCCHRGDQGQQSLEAE